MKVDGIFGPPGTGKTRTLLGMANGQRALFLSFTKAAALEVKSRIEDHDAITASTIHSIAFNQLGCNRAQIVDSKKLVQFGNETGIPFKGGDDGADEIQEGDEYASVLSFANNRMIQPVAAYEHFGCPGTRHRFINYVESYKNWKSTFGYMDFDDMLHQYLERGPKMPHQKVFLDEAQDCSPLQWAVFRHMVRDDAIVTLAGDDDQAIYEWNGADPHGMIDFLQSTEGEMRVLDRSHRIPHVVHDLVHSAILPQINRRVEKKFTPRGEVGSVTRYGDVHHVDFHRIYKDGGGMILVRDRWKLDEVKKMLNRDMIPYAVLGGSSPWTSRIARELRDGGKPDIPEKWRLFYAQADLNAPINITVSTIHQAKGREAPRVVVDLGLPTRTLAAMYNDRDAELRVMYVALTRASHELILCGSNPLL